VTLKKKPAAALAAAGLAAGLSLAGTGSARAAIAPPTTWKAIFNPYLHAKVDTLCFEDPGASTTLGAQVQLGHCHEYNSDGTLQRRVFDPIEDDNGIPVTDGVNNVYFVYNLAANRCLGTIGEDGGLPPVLINCNTGTSIPAIRELVPTTSTGPDFQLEEYTLEHPHPTGWCIAANDASDNVPTGLSLAACNSSDIKQLWNFG
jgi:hypothetical protein